MTVTGNPFIGKDPAARAGTDLIRPGGRTREIMVGQDRCPPLRAVGIDLTGCSEARPGFRFYRPAPGNCQLLACLEGCGRVLVDGSWRELRTGQAYATPMRQPHAYEAQGPRPWRLSWVSWDVPVVPLRAPTIIPFDGRSLTAAIESLHREAEGPHELVGIWAEAVHRQALQAFAAGGRRARLAPVWEAVEFDPAAPWTLARLALRSGLGPEQVRRLCLQERGESPMRCVAAIRLSRATYLLSATDLRLDDIAAQVGYESVSSLCTAFRRRFRVTPMAWRRRTLATKEP